MAHTPGEAKAGTTTVSERVERDWLAFPTIPALQEAWIQRLAGAMLERMRSLKDATEKDALGVGNNYDFQRLYISRLQELSRGMGHLGAKEVLTESQAANAWNKIIELAYGRYQEMKFRAAAPPLPKAPPVEEPIEVEPIVDEEAPTAVEPSPEIQEALTHFDTLRAWSATPLDSKTLEGFNGAFFPMLLNALDKAASKHQRALVFDAAKRKYEDIVLPMYREQLKRAYEAQRARARELAQKPPLPFDESDVTSKFSSWLNAMWPNIESSAGGR